MKHAVAVESASQGRDDVRHVWLFDEFNEIRGLALAARHRLGQRQDHRGLAKKITAS